MFANPHRGEALLKIGGASYLFRPSFEAAAEIEARCEKPLAMMAALSAEFGLPMGDLISVLDACARAAGAPLPENACPDLGILAAQTTAFRLLSALLTGGRDFDEQPDDPDEGAGDEFPIRRAMEIATGVLGWTPGEFWRSTPHEYMAALAGLSLKNGGKPASDKSKFERFKAAVAAAEAKG